MKNAVVKFLRDEEGATAIEYGLIAGLISVAIIAVLGTMKTSLIGLFDGIADALSAATPGAAATPE